MKDKEAQWTSLGDQENLAFENVIQIKKKVKISIFRTKITWKYRIMLNLKLIIMILIRSKLH